MAIIAGKDASVTVGGNTYNFSSWQAEFNSDFVNTTVFGASWKSFAAGLKVGRLTLRGPHDYGALAFTLGAQVTVALKLSSNTLATGSMNVESLKPSADANDASLPTMLEVSGQTSGTWTLSFT